jgi:CrcB protein
MLGVYIFLGGGIGSLLRYLVNSNITRYAGAHFPYGTLAVNVVGSFAMGIIIEYFTKTLPNSNELRAFLTIGILGGCTTFSAFSLDSVILFERGEIWLACLYILASVLLSILAVFAGIILIRGC